MVYVDQGYLVVDGGAASADTVSASQYLKHERRDGRFRRVFKLTSKSNADAVQSSVQDGVLRVVVPKALPKEEESKGKEVVDVPEKEPAWKLGNYRKIGSCHLAYFLIGWPVGYTVYRNRRHRVS